MTGSVLLLAACASAPKPVSSSEAWATYRDEVTRERDRGLLTAVQAEEKIQAKYRELYGPDPTMEGAFAYGRDLYAMAQAGKLPESEADAFANARIDEIFARRAARDEYHAWMEKRFPPEPSD